MASSIFEETNRRGLNKELDDTKLLSIKEFLVDGRRPIWWEGKFNAIKTIEILVDLTLKYMPKYGYRKEDIEYYVRELNTYKYIPSDYEMNDTGLLVWERNRFFPIGTCYLEEEYSKDSVIVIEDIVEYRYERGISKINPYEFIYLNQLNKNDFIKIIEDSLNVTCIKDKDLRLDKIPYFGINFGLNTMSAPHISCEVIGDNFDYAKILISDFRIEIIENLAPHIEEESNICDISLFLNSLSSSDDGISNNYQANFILFMKEKFGKEYFDEYKNSKKYI